MGWIADGATGQAVDGEDAGVAGSPQRTSGWHAWQSPCRRPIEEVDCVAPGGGCAGNYRFFNIRRSSSTPRRGKGGQGAMTV